MKQLILSLLTLLITTTAIAQYRDVVLPEKPKQTGYKNYDKEDTGFWCAIETDAGSSVMEGKTNMQYADLHLTAGYRVNEFLRFGLGFGLRTYLNNASVRNSDSRFGIPIFANIRGNFLSAQDRDGAPFWSFNIGGITNDGFYASPTIGYRFGGLRNNFLVGINYSIVGFKNCNKRTTAYSYIGLKFGYEF